MSSAFDHAALIVQGGGQKGAFSAGVLDSFMDADFDPFDLYLGTSSGALNIAPFVSKQRGYALDFILNYTTSERFFHLPRFVRKQQPMDLDWAFNFIHTGEFPLDIEKGRGNLGKGKQALACLTRTDTLQDHYYPIFAEDWFNILKATCAIPVLYYNDIEFDGHTWVDGGVSATIPVMEAYRRGFKQLVVIQMTPLSGEVVLKREDRFERLRRNFEESLLNYQRRESKQGASLSLASSTENSEPTTPRSSLLDQIEKKVDALLAEKKRQETFLQEQTRDWGEYLEDLLRVMVAKARQFDFDASNAKMLEMLIAHYDNHAQIEAFLDKPPEEANIFRIAPMRPLKSSSLMSERDDLLEDYQHGKLVAMEFLKQHVS
uniref:patatin-like phospholipase family protein n=1 Tax=Thaumasiovibrio subtropicus TaxID=1891207 RepID=UPI00131AAA7C|nr:patatin family protein [Thaumasiovibrio subtropicus]